MLITKLRDMQDQLREMQRVAVAFSAGVDSTFILKVALETLGARNVVAVTSRSPSVPAAELDEARRLAESLGAEHVVLDTDEFANPQYTANPTNRCYFCKNTLYTHMRGFLERRGIQWIVNGTNADDLGDWRPGLQAASEHGVCAPAADAGLTKADIRELSRMMGLPTHDKPASPCLSSRIPYGHEVTPEKLLMVDRAERFLREEFDVAECRVRHYGDLARIEAPLEDIARLSTAEGLERMRVFMRGLGFERTEIDPRGFRSGSLNEVIAFGRRQEAQEA